MNLEHVLGSPARVRVLRALFSKDGMSGRSISARARVSPSSGKAALDELVFWGIVLKVPSGKRHLYELNQSHVFTPVLSELFAVERRLLSRIAKRVARALGHGSPGGVRGVGVDRAGRAVLLLAPPLPGKQESQRIERLLWFSFGLRLAALTTDPEEMRGLDHVWIAEAGAARKPDEAVRELIRFFDLSE